MLADARGVAHAALPDRHPRTAIKDFNVTDLDSNPRSGQLANPFRPGNGVAPPYLAGRDAPLGEFERYLGESHSPHANWTLTGIRGTGKRVLLGEFATRGERAGWLCLGREFSDRHRDDARLADAIADDGAALVRRCNSLEDRYLVAGVAGQRVLDTMARAGGHVSALTLRRSLADLPNVDVVVRRLVDRGLVYRPTRGTYDFALPLFGSYLRRRAELTELTGRR